MNKKNHQYKDAKDFHNVLKKDFPIIWREPEKGWWPCPSVTSFWYPAIYTCSEDIEKVVSHYANKSNLSIEYLPCVVQVKEKFGSLRFYLDRVNNLGKKIETKIYSIISRTEEEVNKICMSCGVTGAEQRKTFPDHQHLSFIKNTPFCEKCWRKEALAYSRNCNWKELREWFANTIVCTKFEEEKG